MRIHRDHMVLIGVMVNSENEVEQTILTGLTPYPTGNMSTCPPVLFVEVANYEGNSIQDVQYKPNHYIQFFHRHEFGHYKNQRQYSLIPQNGIDRPRLSFARF